VRARLDNIGAGQEFRFLCEQKMADKMDHVVNLGGGEIFDKDEYEQAYKWVKKNCIEGLDANSDDMKWTRDELDETWKGIKSSTKDVRDDVKMRDMWRYTIIKANSWKPTEQQMEQYKEWHIANIGEIDPNWNKFMDVPYIDMKEEYVLKRLGEVIYDNC